LRCNTKHMRACQEGHTLESLVFHATGFLFNCVSPIKLIFTIITDTTRRIKMAIVDSRITPDVAVNDPELMVSMPPSLTAATGMDALTHAVEAYVSTMATPTTDAAAIKAIELIAKYLPA